MLTPTDAVSLTSNQARIAALAFDVLYNKPFLNEETLLNEDPSGTAEVTPDAARSLDRANQLCKEQEDDKYDGSTVSQESMKECAQPGKWWTIGKTRRCELG